MPNSADPALRAKAAPNQDGHLTLEEYCNGFAKKDNAEGRFKNFDQNHDGKVTRGELAGPISR
ncbi:EF-hand domain-containing protein [Prosthecobacter sp.]